MSYCTKCGQMINEGTSFCPYCGKGVNTVTPKKFNMFTAYAEMFKRYADFSGRSTQSEFWYVYLIHIIMEIIVIGFTFFAIAFSETYCPDWVVPSLVIISIITIIYGLAAAVPWVALGIRRLHDTGKSGWFYMLNLIPEVGGIIFLVLCIFDSQPGTNKYGPNPKE